MKKIYYLMAMAMMAFTFTSCEDVPEPFGQPINPNGPEEVIEPTGTGTEADPFNIAAAIEKCQEVGETGSSEKYYIKGIVTEGGEIPAGDTYGNITFKMGDTQDSKKTFMAYQVFGSDGVKLPVGFKVEAGAEVVVYGPIVNYKGNTPETQGKGAAHIVTINGKKTDGTGGGSGTGGGTGGESQGEGTEAAPYNVTAAIAAGTAANSWVKGYIVGYVPGQKIAEAVFAATGEVAVSNILIAASADETDYNKCMPIQLPANTDIRTKLNLKDNAGNLKKEVVLYGNIEKYFSVPGMKSTSYAVLNGTEIGTKPGSGSGDTPTGDAILSVSFDAGKGDFTIDDKSIGDGITYVWSEDKTNKYMKASAYKGGCIAAESWLVSPAFSLKNTTSPVMTFNNACNKVNNGTITDHIKVMVFDGTNWAEATITGMPDGKSWTFVDSSVDLKEYAGKENVKVAFKYVSTTAVAPTWEIKTVTIK